MKNATNEPLKRGLPARIIGRRSLIRRPALPRIPLSRKTARRSLTTVLFLTGGLGFALLAGLFALHLRLQEGPISIDSLVPPLEQAINGELNGLRVNVGSAILRYATERGGLQFRLKNVRLVEPDGATVAIAPLAAVTLSRNALLSGQMAAERIDFIEPRLLLYYNEESGLSFSFSRPDSSGVEAEGQHGAPAASGGQGRTDETVIHRTAVDAGEDEARRINLATAMAQALHIARKRETASSYLRNFGMRDARVTVERDGRQSYWRVPYLMLDFEHRQKRSIINTQALVESETGPWKLQLRTEQSDKNRRIRLSGRFAGLVPNVLLPVIPELAALGLLEMPVSGHTDLVLRNSGDIENAGIDLTIGEGRIAVPLPWSDGFDVRDGELRIRYSREKRRWQILPSTLQDGANRIAFTGALSWQDEQQGWRVDIRSEDGVIGADVGGDEGERIRSLAVRGLARPGEDWLQLQHFRLLLDQGGLAIAGQVSAERGLELAGRLATMPTASFKRLWPSGLAPETRDWFIENVRGGRVSDGTLTIRLPAEALASDSDATLWPDDALEMEFRGENLTIDYADGLAGLAVPKARLKLGTRSFRLDVPKGKAQLPSGRSIAVRDGQLVVPNWWADLPSARVSLTASGSAAAFADYLGQKPLGMTGPLSTFSERVTGNVEAALDLGFPLASDFALEDVRISGRAKLEEAGVADVFGEIDAHGASVDVTVSERAVEARGELLLNGVPAKLRWLNLKGADADDQPPLQLSARLDETERSQLGLEVNHMVRGPVQVDLILTPDDSGSFRPQVRADLVNAELELANLSWRKPPGQTAVLNFEIAEGEGGQTELRNFKILGGDRIAIDGWIKLGSDNRLASFSFPDFSLDVITQLAISGELDANDIWDIQVRGRLYDGRAFFRSLFSAESLGQSGLAPSKRRAGMDLTARIDSVVGFFDTSLQDLRLHTKKRGGKLVVFEADGKFDNDADLAVRLRRSDAGKRFILAESEDAGRAFKLIGFYPNVRGGDASLRVNLDGRGAAAKTGTLWTRNFTLLGDEIVTEVLSEAPNRVEIAGSRSNGARTRTQRAQLDFSQMRVPFSVGHGQFVLHDSYINGPLLGATMRGKVDYARKRVQLGGTYVPLYGLNSALGAFPIIGGLLVGRRGEGILGITFAIQGRLSNPQVMVNPISMVAPGIFRQIFEFIEPTPSVQPRGTQTPAEEDAAPQMSSSSPIFMPQGGENATWPDEIPEWTTETQR